MTKSVLEAIKLGFWDFEPPELGCDHYQATDAMPGTPQKLDVLAARIPGRVAALAPQGSRRSRRTRCGA